MDLWREFLKFNIYVFTVLFWISVTIISISWGVGKTTSYCDQPNSVSTGMYVLPDGNVGFVYEGKETTLSGLIDSVKSKSGSR